MVFLHKKQHETPRCDTFGWHLGKDVLCYVESSSDLSCQYSSFRWG